MTNININQVCANKQAFKSSVDQLQTAFDSKVKWIAADKNTICIKQKNWRITRIVKQILSLFGDLFSKVRCPKVAKNLLVYCAMNHEHLDADSIKVAIAFLTALNVKTKGKYKATIQSYVTAIHLLTPKKTGPSLGNKFTPPPILPDVDTTTPTGDTGSTSAATPGPTAPQGTPPPPPPPPKGGKLPPLKAFVRSNSTGGPASPTASPSKASGKPAAQAGSPRVNVGESPLFLSMKAKNAAAEKASSP